MNDCHHLLTYLIRFVPGGHRAITASFRFFLSFATIFISPQVFPIFFASCDRSLLQVFFGLPLFLFPRGFHSRAWRVTLVFFFLNVWPIHLHFLVVMVCMTGSFLVIFHRFLLLIFSGHLIPVMFLRHLLMKTCIVLVEAAVDLHVSDPYRRTDFTLELKILIFVAVLIALLLQIGLRIAKACSAFFFLALTSSSVQSN